MHTSGWRWGPVVTDQPELTPPHPSHAYDVVILLRLEKSYYSILRSFRMSESMIVYYLKYVSW